MESKNDFNCLFIGEQSESMQRGQWHPQSQGSPTYQATCRMNQHVQEEFRQSKQRTEGFNGGRECRTNIFESRYIIVNAGKFSSQVS